MRLVESLIDGVVDIRSHIGRTILQTLGIILGVASVVATFSLIESGKQESMRIYAETGGLNTLYVGPEWQHRLERTAQERASKGLVLDDAWAIRDQIDGVLLVDPRTGRRLTVRYLDFQEERYIMGVTPAHARARKIRIARGRFISDLDLDFRARIVVLGSDVAQRIFGSADPIGKLIALGDHRFQVVGVTQKKSATFRGSSHNALAWMNRQLYVPITTIHTFYQGDKKISGIRVFFDSLARHKIVQADIEALMLRRHGARDVRVYNRSERIETQRQQSLAFEIVLQVTGAVALLVGGIVIMNILLASFHERVREVGIRKALGATGLDITIQFLVESVLITLLGGVIGIFVGWALVITIGRILEQAAFLTPTTVILAFAFSVAVGIFFGFYPAVKAARLDPIEALRYE
jgi:putative ABC transport system permease protein